MLLKNPPLFTKQNVVTVSRSIGTVFQNLTGKPMLVSVVIRILAPGDVAAVSGKNNPPSPPFTNQVARVTNNMTVTAGTATIDFDLVFIVPYTYFYEIVIAGGTGNSLQLWTEWT